jgi:hypothetical protein
LERSEQAGGYLLNPCNYTFKASNSYFDYSVAEQRFTRNKTTIKSFVRVLQASFVWEYVVNKDDYIKVNHYNLKTKKDTMSKQLQDIVKK